jgi:pimeloyl-ACP methyl ester carboxylesterase
VHVVAAVASLALFAGCSSSPKDHPAQPSTPSSSAAASTSAPSPTAPGLQRFYAQKPTWKGCGDGFRCARIVVPLDYSAPAGATITIAVNRRPADSKSKRIGSLVVNPGGPGASGLNYARAADGIVTSRLLKRFDLVGFDPRGVGASSPVRCLNDPENDVFLAADGSPDSSAEEERIVQLSQLFVQRCREHSGALIAHLSTRDTARDLDVLRGVLGDPQLYYLGKSYGTYLGETYAELFPHRVGRLVLDGVVDPALSSDAANRVQALGFERALAAFAADCVKRNSCPYRGSQATALTAIARLLDRVDVHPLSAEPGRPLTQALAELGVAFGLYDKSFWSLLREALSKAENGDGSALLTMSDLYDDRDEHGHYTTNAIAAQYAVNCSDRPEEKDLATVRSFSDRLQAEAPHFGAYLGWSSLPCAYWPYPPAVGPHPVRAAGAKPILLVGTTRDPATPYAEAQAVEKQLQSARLLTYVGDGHTAYRGSSSCIDDAVDRYLIEGKLPAAGKRCK